jgi:hypothetical protein
LTKDEENERQLEIEGRGLRFKATGPETFVSASLDKFMTEIFAKLHGSEHISDRPIDVDAPISRTSPQQEDASSWWGKIAAKSGINEAYIKPFFKDYGGLLAPMQWNRTGTANIDGPNIAYVVLYANKYGNGLEKISGRKISPILESLGVGDIGNQSRYIKAEKGIIGGSGWYSLNPSGEKKAVELLKNQVGYDN